MLVLQRLQFMDHQQPHRLPPSQPQRHTQQLPQVVHQIITVVVIRKVLALLRAAGAETFLKISLQDLFI